MRGTRGVVQGIVAAAATGKIRYPLLSDFGRKMLPEYRALVTDDKSPIYRYAKRAYFILSVRIPARSSWRVKRPCQGVGRSVTA